eukprot:1195101-Prorocentrum_minimum.AAC.4
MLMNAPPGSESMDAVPKRTNRPELVIGREVPGLLPANACSTEELPGRAVLVPGLAKPVSGLPLADIGRTPCRVFGIACDAISSKECPLHPPYLDWIQALLKLEKCAPNII